MKLLIVAPSSKNLYQELASKYSAIETNIWAGLLAQSVRRVVDVAIYDLEADAPKDDKEFASRIEQYDPDFALFVVTGQNPNASTAAMDGAVKAAEEFKRVRPETKVGFIGPHIAALPHEVLTKHQCVDIVFINEGVFALSWLIENKFNPVDVPGVWYREGNDIHINKPSPLVKQEDMHIDLPGIAYDLMPSLDKYRTSLWHTNYKGDISPFASIYTSLGCIYKCSFCMINILNRTDNDLAKASSSYSTFRYWDPNFTIKQFDYLASKGVKNIKVADEMWVLKPKHFMTLCDLLIERDYGFNIWAYTRVDTVKPEYLEKLKAAGVNWLALGIEAANQEVRREITKGRFENINIRDVVKMIQSHDINVGANYIVGLGNDTWDTMQETLNLALELNAENSNIYAATALPGSPLYLEAKSNGWELPDTYSGYGFLSYDHVPSRTPTLSSAEVLGFRDYAFHTLFENPRFLNMIHNRFGEDSVKNIKEMTSIKLKRKLLGD